MHSCQRIYKLHSPLHSLSNTHTHVVCVCVSQKTSQKTPTNTNIYAYTYTDACRKHSSTHSHRVESQDPEMCSHLHYLKIDKRGRQQTIIPRAQGGGNKKKKRSKTEKTNRGDVIRAKWQALCEKDWRVYSYLLLPGFQYQHHRKHIRCFSFRWLTHKDEHKLPSVFEEN